MKKLLLLISILILSQSGFGQDDFKELKNAKSYKHFDTLNFKYYNLKVLPYEVTKCKNLRSLNLGYCYGMDLEDCFEKISSLKKLSELKILVHSLDKIPEKYWHKITGIIAYNMSEKEFLNVLKQEQLTYLEINNCEYENISHEFKNLKKLKHLIIRSNLRKLPKEISGLKNLESINLVENEELDRTDCFEKLEPLKNLKEINVSLNSLNDIPKKYWYRITSLRISQINNTDEIKQIAKLTQLTNLTIQHCNIELPKEIGNLKNLVQLRIENCNLETLPKEIGNLKKLKSLVLYSNKLTELPKEIGELKVLKSLDLAGNNLTRLPKEIANLENLISLRLEQNPKLHIVHLLKSFKNYKRDIVISASIFEIKFRKTKLTILIPKQTIFRKEMTEIENLTELVLDGCINNIPREIKKLKRLEILDLSYSFLESLPKEIGELKNLKELHLEKCRVETLPKEIWKLKNLEILDLSYNDLDSLPKEIGEFKNLKELYIRKCKIETFTEHIWELKNLEILDFAENEISNISPKIENLQKLRKLYLEENDIEKLPPEIKNLTQLTVLKTNKSEDKKIINENIVNSIFKNIDDLKTRRILDLREKDISHLPKEIGELKKLKKLNLSSNHLTTLPKEIVKLKNLEELYLTFNSINLAKLFMVLKDFPKKIAINNYDNTPKDTDILYISLSIDTIPKEIGEMKNLVEFNSGLPSNINFIPKEIGNLENLEILDLSSFKSTKIPEEIKNLKKLKKLTLSIWGNEFSEEEKQKIRNWFPNCKIEF